MPALPPNSLTRRKGATPCKKLQQDDVWRRSLHVLGLEEMTAHSSYKSPTSDLLAMDPPIDSTTAPKSKPTTAPSKKLTFLDLPSETKKGIFKHASCADLIALSLVSKHFRDLASAELYRSFHILFPDEDDPSSEYPFDSLAGGLETFVTSEYNYAGYLREFIMETQSGGEKGERAYRHYLFDVSCGKFMNTLLLLTLRKARVLETFRWDIRVELSRPVFKALHQIPTLQHLHIRMQSGPSIYQPLLPLPTSVLPPAHGMVDSADGSTLAPLPPILPVPAGSPNSFPFGHKIAKICQKPPVAKLAVKPSPTTLSGFKNLKTLTILEMDTLEYVDELRDCVRNSSATLGSLRLSFSEGLVNRSRKPQPDPQSDDESDQEDEFGQLIPPPGPPINNPALGASDPNIPSKIMKAQEEKKKQEAALGRIFGLDNVSPKPKVPTTPKLETEKPQSEEDPRRRFIRNLAPVAAKLMSHIKPGSDMSAEGKATLAMIENAAKTYLDAMDKTKENNPVASPGSSTEKATPASSSLSTDDAAAEDVVMSGAVADGPGLFDEPEKKKKFSNEESEISNPDDINIEEPEGKELAIEFEAPTMEVVQEQLAETTETKVEETEPEAAATLVNKLGFSKSVILNHKSIEAEGGKLLEKMKEFKAKLEAGELSDVDRQAIIAADGELQVVSQRIEELTKTMKEASGHFEATHDPPRRKSFNSTQMSEYIRTTRGLTLESFSLYMIPIKASILSRAIDLHVLQSITLLNVGTQTPFWNLLIKENKLQPLRLHKIHTDNVTLPFLLFLSQLDNLTELIMMERISKDRSESAVAKTTITTEQIRKIVLKKHASTLKVLVIRNDTIGMEWDLNIKTAMLLCERAKNLEELGCSFGSRTMHTLLQYMPGLISLRVLHTIAFHNTDDACAWVMREFRKFCVDNISHNPEMKLEYLALDQSVERLVRRKPMPKPKLDKKGKGKEFDWTSAKALAELVMGSNNVTASAGWGEESKYDFPDSSDDEDGIVKTGLRVETIDGIRFSDVIGVRIFERDVITGKL